MKIDLAATVALISLAATGVNAAVIKVKLDPNADKEAILKTFSSMKDVVSVRPLIPLPKETLDKLTSAKEGLPDLSLWYQIVTDGELALNEGEGEGIDTFGSVDGVVNSKIQGPPPPPPGARPARATRARTPLSHTQNFISPDYVPDQGYLGPQAVNNNGIEAEYSWTVPGGSGEGITVYDIEYGWTLNHEDWTREVKLLMSGEDEGNQIENPFGPDHGTAVLGEMVSGDNGLGVKGISFDANPAVAPELTTLYGSNRALAITLATADAKAGDVILLEMQTWVCGSRKFGPAEGDDDVFEATKVAVANGITVVAAAGNGDVDLDSELCGSKYDRSVRDSGAIIVGAGGSGVGGSGACNISRQKMWFSSYGSRVDVQGWGECVYSAGFGNLYTDPNSPGDATKWYTDSFSGTSSASPIVAGAVANIQGIAMRAFGAPLTPLEVRDLLKRTGTPQAGSDQDQNIGPLVNLKSAIQEMFHPSKCKATRKAFKDSNDKIYSCDKLQRVSKSKRKKKCRKDPIRERKCFSICYPARCPCTDNPFPFTTNEDVQIRCKKLEEEGAECQIPAVRKSCPGTCDKQKCPVARS